MVECPNKGKKAYGKKAICHLLDFFSLDFQVIDLPSGQRRYKSTFQPICGDTGQVLSGVSDRKQRVALYFHPSGLIVR